MKRTTFVIFLTILIFGSFVSGQEKIDFSIELVDGNNEEVTISSDIDSSKALMLKVTATNPSDKWIFFEKLSVDVECKHNAESFDCYTGGVVVNLPVLPPTSKTPTYIPLEGYVNLPEGDRIGTWQITFKGGRSIGGAITCFEEETLKEKYCTTPDSPANPLEFKVTKKDIELPDEEGSLTIEPPSGGWGGYIWWIIGGIITIVVAYYLTHGKKKKR